MNNSLKKGDKVRFLNEVGEGVVIGLIDKDTALVMTGYDFEIPYKIKDLVLVGFDNVLKSNSQNIENKIENQNKKPSFQIENDKSILPDGIPNDELKKITDMQQVFYPDEEFDLKGSHNINVYFAFVPVSQDLAATPLNCYLINDSPYTLMYNYIVKSEEWVESKAAGVLESDTKVLLAEYSKEQLNDLIDIAFQFIFYAKGKYFLQKPIHFEMEINPVKYYKETSFRENDFFDIDALIFEIVNNDSFKEKIEQIDKTDIQRIIMQKDDIQEIPRVIKNKPENAEVMEVDLHINELLENNRGLSNTQMIDIQMNHFKAKLDEAIRMKYKKVIFIHGLGNGKLKLEIRKVLEQMKFIYNDASFKEYGYGATMVLIEQNKNYSL